MSRKNLEIYLERLEKLFNTDPVKAVCLAVPIKHLINLFYDGVPLEGERITEIENFLESWEEIYEKEGIEGLDLLLKRAHQLALLPLFD